MSRARNLADLLDASGDVSTAALDNVPPNTALVDSSDNTVIDTATGNVGIGTSSPEHSLHIKSGTANEPSIKLENTVSSGADPSIIFADSVENYGWRVGADDTGNNLVVTYKNDGTVPVHGLDSEVMRIDGTGAEIKGKLKVTNSDTPDVNPFIELHTTYTDQHATILYRHQDGSSGYAQGSLHFSNTSSGVAGEDLALVGVNQCTGWVSFNGTNGAIHDAFNVSSVTRTGLGLYTIYIHEDFDNGQYVVLGTAQNSNNNVGINTSGTSQGTASINIMVRDIGGNNGEDRNYVCVAFFGGRDASFA